MTSISFRLTDSLLDGFSQEAHEWDVTYQSLVKVWRTKKLREVNG